MSTLLDRSSINSEDLEQLLQERTEGKVEFILVDVREDMEYEESHIEGVDILRPTSTFQDWVDPLLEETKDQIVIFTCRTDYRSGQVQNVLRQRGHARAINHAGGITSYRGKVARG